MSTSKTSERAADTGDTRGSWPYAITELLHFVQSCDPGNGEGLPADLLPVHVRPFLNEAEIRTEYPIVVYGDGAESEITTLRSVIDDLLEELDADGDDAERLRRDVLKIERGIRQVIDESDDTSFKALWMRSEKMLLGDKAAHEDRRAALSALRNKLPLDARVLPCTPATAIHVVQRVQERRRERVVQSARDRTAELVLKLQDVLAADDGHAPEKHDSEHLEASVGPAAANDIDFDALSNLLDSVQIDIQLPEKRRERIRRTLDTLQTLAARILGAPISGDNSDAAGRSVEPETSVDAAWNAAEANRNDLVAFIRAFHVATLEAENRYREDEHDDFFVRFGWKDLTTDDRTLFPPVLLVQFASDLTPDGWEGLRNLLSSRVPVHAVLLRDSAGSDAERVDGAFHFNTSADSFALKEAVAGTCAVLQAPLSALPDAIEQLQDLMACDRAVLIDVYTGSADMTPELPTYLRSAAAFESRVAPGFACLPASSGTLAERFNIALNIEPAAVWPAAEFPESVSDSGVESVSPFTPVHLMACDERCSPYFKQIPDDLDDERLVPVHQAIESSDESDIPFLVVRGPDERLYRYAVAHDLVTSVRDVMNRWKMLRELGGTANSWAAVHVRKESERMRAEAESEIDAVRERYEAELDKAVDAVAEQVVENLAGQLLGLTARPHERPADTSSSRPAPRTDITSNERAPADEPESPASTSEQPASTAEPPTSTSDAEADTEDEPLVLDEAYIDTPLCTSCNECTNLNGQMFAYDDNKQAYIKDATAGPFKDLVVAAEKCPVRIIHPGKPQNPDEPNLDALVERAAPFNA